MEAVDLTGVEVDIMATADLAGVEVDIMAAADLIGVEVVTVIMAMILTHGAEAIGTTVGMVINLAGGGL